MKTVLARGLLAAFFALFTVALFWLAASGFALQTWTGDATGMTAAFLGVITGAMTIGVMLEPAP